MPEAHPVSLNNSKKDEDDLKCMADMFSLFCQTIGIPDTDGNAAGESSDNVEGQASGTSASYVENKNKNDVKSARLRVVFNGKQESIGDQVDLKSLQQISPNFVIRKHRRPLDEPGTSSASFVSLPPASSVGGMKHKRRPQPNTYKVEWSSFANDLTSSPSLNGRARFSHPNTDSSSLDEILHHSSPNLSNHFFKGTTLFSSLV